VIVEGIHARFRMGKTLGEGFSTMGELVDQLAHAALEVADRSGVAALAADGRVRRDGWTGNDRPRLASPVMIAAFEGWNDASEAATGAAARWARAFGAEHFATIDPDAHLDYRKQRPRVRLVDGVTREVLWTANRFLAATTGGLHDAVVLMGVEPSRHWRSFCRAVLEVVATTGCEMVLTLGALLADVPHTRPPVVTGSATDPALIRGLGLRARATRADGDRGGPARRVPPAGVPWSPCGPRCPTTWPRSPTPPPPRRCSPGPRVTGTPFDLSEIRRSR